MDDSDENLEKSVPRMSNNENGSKPKDITEESKRFLESIPNPKVKMITGKLMEMDISSEKKLVLLEQGGLNRDQLDTVRDILEGETHFLDDLTESDQEFVEYFISKRKDDMVLEQTVYKPGKYGKKTKDAYEKWKKKQRAQKTDCEDSEEERHSGPSSVSAPAEESESMTILLMGETGVGKSTFINTLVNMIAFPDFHTALRYEFHVPIKTRLAYCDPNFNRRTITYEPTVSANTEGVELCEDGTSCTQKPTTYVFRFGSFDNHRELKIIDTPGFGDTRGEDVDKKNLQNILDGIAYHQELHAIVYLMKSNESKLSKGFCYCLDEFFAHLHKKAKENILFCLTHSRGTNYLPGETLTTLEAYLKSKKLDIPLIRENLFSVENDSFRYMCAVKKGANLADGEETYIDSWNRTVLEYTRLLKKISSLDPHKVYDMLSVNNIRQIIEDLKVPLVEVSRQYIKNIEEHDNTLMQLERLNQGEESSVPMKFEETYLMTLQLDSPILVCEHPKCMDSINGENNHTKVCFSGKISQSAKLNCKGEAMVRSCEVFKNSESCQCCGHSFKEHKYINYRIISRTRQIMDSEEGKKGVEKASKVLREKKEDYERELLQITNSMAIFAVFLKDHSILAYDDSAREHFDLLIKAEAFRDNDSIKNTLEQYKEKYLEQVAKIDRAGTSRARSLEELNKLITDLKKSKNCGQFLRDVEYLELSAKRKQQTSEEIVVTLANDCNKNIWPH